MFEQIATYYTSGAITVSGVLNFRAGDISHFHVSQGGEFASLLLKDSKVLYTVMYDDLKKIIEKDYQ